MQNSILNAKVEKRRSFDFGPDFMPEKMLLFSVLERALLDLIHNFSRCGTKVDSPKREKEKLIRWFLADNRNEYCSFKSICSELSLSHTYLLRALKDKGYL